MGTNKKNNKKDRMDHGDPTGSGFGGGEHHAVALYLYLKKTL
jgi:hypothetical protein